MAWMKRLRVVCWNVRFPNRGEGGFGVFGNVMHFILDQHSVLCEALHSTTSTLLCVWNRHKGIVSDSPIDLQCDYINLFILHFSFFALSARQRQRCSRHRLYLILVQMSTAYRIWVLLFFFILHIWLLLVWHLCENIIAKVMVGGREGEEDGIYWLWIFIFVRFPICTIHHPKYSAKDFGTCSSDIKTN